MSYQGRSPINDVVRSVMSAAMISPIALASCGTQKVTTPDPKPDDTTANIDPTATPTVTATVTVTATATSTAVATATATATGTASAKPDVLVHPSARPRPDGNGGRMPTRGFAGAVRAARS
jgi:hypothetical protein